MEYIIYVGSALLPGPWTQETVMFKSAAAKIAAQQQASLFEGDAEEFALVSQDAKGKDVEAAAIVAKEAGAALEAAYPFGYRSSDSAP